MKDLFSDDEPAPPPEAAPPATTEPCPACTKAAVRLCGQFISGCKGCCARATARGRNFHRVRAAGYQDSPYRAELAQFGLTHEDVKAAAAADFEIVNKGRPRVAHAGEGRGPILSLPASAGAL